MSVSDLILITLSIPMVFITGILFMLNHEYKKAITKASEKSHKTK
jgi:cbb3-type cytochrome oxidase subunit 3